MTDRDGQVDPGPPNAADHHPHHLAIGDQDRAARIAGIEHRVQLDAFQVAFAVVP